MPEVTLTVNGEPRSASVPARTLLVHLLRETLGVTSPHVGCDTTQCGACTVHLDGRAVKSCTVLAVQAQGRSVTTLEGAGGDTVEALTAAFHDCHAVQCGFCTPGMIMSSAALLRHRPRPTEDEIRVGLRGNLCRCTGYQHIVDAVLAAAETIAQPGHA
jgi:aerobic carbon-monoxide dehydrogenase small subunit